MYRFAGDEEKLDVLHGDDLPDEDSVLEDDEDEEDEEDEEDGDGEEEIQEGPKRAS